MAELALARPLASNDQLSFQFMHEDLAKSGLVPEDIRAYPVAPIAMGTCPGYCIPYADPRMYRVRYKRDEDKYIQPKGIVSVWWSHLQNKDLFRNAPTLYIIEGEKKAAKFVKTWPHLPTLGIGGCWMFLKKTETDTKMLLPEILKCLTPGMNVVAIFDGDIMAKLNIQKAAYELKHLLMQQECHLRLFRTPIGKGVDDWLVECPTATLHDLKEISFDNLAISRGAVYQALGLYLTDKGIPISHEANIKKLVRFYYAGHLVNDKRRGLKKSGTYVSFEQLMSDVVIYIQEEHIAMATVPRIRNALEYFIQEVQCDLVKDKFETLVWDGEERLNTWGQEYFESDMPEYCAEWGRLLMTGLVFRVLYPGSKVDYVPILVGPQGIGKTSFFEDLAVFDGEKYYHSCSNITPEVGDQNRTQCTIFNKNIIIDLGEGAAFNPKKVDQENFKQFITQTVDEYRVVYHKSSTINPRSFIFVGTSNRRDQITDRSGSRRFLPIHVSKVKKLPYNEKMQILAEVVAKQQEILASEWYNLNVDWEKMPLPLREKMPFVHDAQTLVNSQFTREDDFTDYVLNILESGEAATYKVTSPYVTKGEMFISSVYLAARYPGRIPVAHARARLSDLALSDLFPWKLVEHKPRLSQLRVPDEYFAYYTNGITAKDPVNQMLSGFIARKKT
jgi:hypothetical protein